MPRHSPEPPAPRARMTPDERRRQLLGIGLRKFVDRPVQELSLDEVAAEAGVSRGLLFHYFPTKTAYHEAVVAAAGRRVLRTVRPDAGVTGEAAVRQIVERYFAQIARRREFYVAFVYGRLGAAAGGAEAAGVTAISLRDNISELVGDALGLRGERLAIAHAWVAYAEDRALQSAARAVGEAGQAGDVDHCVQALLALLELPAVT
ncbi:MAG: TetR/AcrR family transcriptional regulator [Dermatophilaceae bacterium]